jgi:hypothetical protein
MDATIVSAMIAAGTTIGTNIFEKWSGRTEPKTQTFVDAHYNTLRGLVSDNCMKVLKRLEDGQNRSTGQLIVSKFSIRNR